MTTLAHRLRETRESKSWTQQRVSKLSGINVMAISHFECGRRLPSIPNAVKLCDALGCSMDWLTRGIDGSRSKR